MMTLGPLIALVPFAEKARGWMANVLVVFGRVPMFYYLLHIPLIHISALFVNLVMKGAMHGELYYTAPYTHFEEISPWNLGVLYLVFVLDVIILYFACKWYAGYKQQHPENRWLKYI